VLANTAVASQLIWNLLSLLLNLSGFENFSRLKSLLMRNLGTVTDVFFPYAVFVEGQMNHLYILSFMNLP